MFDVGFSEMLVIAIVALIVLGPERLPKAARFAGLWVRKARAQWYSVKAEFENELAAEELQRSVKTPLAELQQAVQDNRRELETDLQAAKADIEAEAAPLAGAFAEPLPADTAEAARSAKGEADPPAAPP